MIVRMEEVRLRDGVMAEYVARCREEVLPRLRDLPGCRDVELLTAVGEEPRVVLVSRWEDAAVPPEPPYLPTDEPLVVRPPHSWDFRPARRR